MPYPATPQSNSPQKSTPSAPPCPSDSPESASAYQYSSASSPAASSDSPPHDSSGRCRTGSPPACAHDAAPRSPRSQPQSTTRLLSSANGQKNPSNPRSGDAEHVRPKPPPL